MLFPAAPNWSLPHPVAKHVWKSKALLAEEDRWCQYEPEGQSPGMCRERPNR